MNSTEVTEIERARGVLRGFSVFSSVFIGLLLSLEIIGIFEKIRTGKKHTIPRALGLLFCLSLFGLLATVIGIMLFYVNWATEMAYSCKIFAQVGITFPYVIMKVCSDLFFFHRMNVIHETLHVNSFFIRMLRMSVLFSIVIATPCTFFPLAMVFFSGAVIPEEVCVCHSITIYPSNCGCWFANDVAHIVCGTFDKSCKKATNAKFQVLLWCC